MLLKLIQCRIRDEMRQAFAAGQSRWDALRGCGGFCGQLGGWSIAEPSLAVIVGLWEDEPAYTHFMRDVHDSVFEGTGQQDSYDTIDVSLWDALFSIPGTVASLAPAVGRAGVLRLARCRLRPGREDHFLDAQRNIWNPGMASAGGMLGGAFSRSTVLDNEFLVCTAWESLDAHEQYKAGPFAGLHALAQVENDCEALQGWVVSIENNWRVMPRPRDR